LTIELADPPGAAGQRQSRVVAACLRAACAWSERESRPAAMREVARMTGVVMEALGPGRGPVTPMTLIECLRRPLGELASLAGGDPGEEIAAAVLLDGDQLADAVYDLACEYALPLTPDAETAPWLPSWTNMRAEQVENQAFTVLKEAGDDAAYARARRFLIEHPAGDRQELSEQIAAAGAKPVKYQGLMADQQYESGKTSWWWPCPVCRWPMAVTGDSVRCRYRPHQAAYQVMRVKPGSQPRLQRTGDHGPAAPKAGPAASAACVAPGVWRFIVVPGATELRLAADLENLGAEVQMWPEGDSYDLHVTAGTLVRTFDVKEYRSTRRLISALRDKPPNAAVLLPRGCEHQAEHIAAALPSLAVCTETVLRRQVKRSAPRSNP
jgi:hypothetical protein